MFDAFLSDTIVQQLGVKRGQKYSVFLKSIFFLILFGNIFGLRVYPMVRRFTFF